MNTIYILRGATLGLLASCLCSLAFDAGPAWDQFPLTLQPGQRLEAAGPLFYKQQSESLKMWAIPPVFSSTRDPDLEYKEYDFLYPLLTYDNFGGQYRWQLMQLLSFAGGPTQTETNRDRFTLYPLVFVQRSSDPDEDYTAVVPFYGKLKHRFARDKTFFILFPLYVETWKKDVHTLNIPFPIFHLREGSNLQGWQVWPLIGHETKGLTYATNGFGDVGTIGGHDRWFALWPIYFNQKNELGTTNAQHSHAVLPAYVVSRAPLRDTTTVLWPFFTWIEDRERKYTEWQGPWPLVAFARGEGKTLNRVLPFYSHGKTANHETRAVAWPFYREAKFQAETVDRRRTRILFFLYSDLMEKNKETGVVRKRTDLWPLFTRRQDLNGNTRLQVLAPLEPILPNNKSIERNYSPIWSLWRDERNFRSGDSSQSLLWNLYRREQVGDVKKTSLMFGLFRYVKDAEGKHVRLFYIPMTSSPAKSRPIDRAEGK